MLKRLKGYGEALVAPWRERRALRCVARGDHISALEPFKAPPISVLSSLGLHAGVLAAEMQATERHLFYQALAEAEFGAVGPALTVLRAEPGRLRYRQQIQLAQAVGRWRPLDAISLLPVRTAILQAALALKAGRPDLAAAVLPAGSANMSPDHHLLFSALATAQGAHRAARRAANQAFRAFGLSVPLDETADAPISLATFSGLGPGHITGPCVSVIMPARNAAATVGVAVHSVLAQTWENIELIVIDDASTDATAAIVTAAIGGDPRARLLRRSVAGGAYAARNDGLQVATGTLATFNDADDWSHPERIERDARVVLGAPQLLAAQSRLVRLSPSGQFTATRVFPLVRANPSSLMFRRPEVLSELGSFEEVQFGADEEFTARLTARFGVRSFSRQPILLLVASATGATLTGAATTGLVSAEGARARVVYREAWHARHLAVHRQLRVIGNTPPQDRRTAPTGWFRPPRPMQ